MTSGFWGKIPSRGDFCGLGLSRPFVTAWDAWISACLAASQKALGEEWHSTWMEAPVWHFTAAPALFGPSAVSGLWMPSVDRAGRLFPLLIATEAAAAPEWFAQAEDAGRAALAEILEPDELWGRLPAASPGVALGGGSVWWTEGSPKVAPRRQKLDTLPPADRFSSMLDDAA